ncbi:MAG: GHMP kinase [Kiritimatiellaeota bacterium]|nr:GHMP kinase [Kiritimatiellota bacterium]
MIIKTRSFPRAALIGNPSDGYFGKTIAFVFRNFQANIQLYETPELDLLPSLRDHSRFDSVSHLVDDVSQYGYYGGIRLLKATIKRFHDYCSDNGLNLDDRNFTIRYQTTIPNRLGLAGSSAIITACVRALKLFYKVDISHPILANLVLSVERDELGIDAGLQDRVAQAYNEPVLMNFDEKIMRTNGYGNYKPITIPDDMNLYIAFRTDLSEGSEILHARLRENYEKGDPKVLAAIDEWIELTENAAAAIEKGDRNALEELINRNFDLRNEVCASVSKKNKLMVELARSVGASAKFTGSGGGVIGTYKDEAMFDDLVKTLGKHKIETIKPMIVTGGRDESYDVSIDEEEQ